ncbi:MAG: hypothetical protein U5J83_03425 [Bryobacterales bacterium]|nr:hypothetical protein [Bryobacterales bacterium]
MKACCMAALAALVLLLSLPTARAQSKWELQYQHLDSEYDLQLFDIAFIDANRGVASGALKSRKRDRVKAVNLTTTDGKNWTVVETKKICQDLHALPEGILFAACEDGIYRSDELGKDWKRQAKLRDIQQIWFLNARRGFAVGLEKGFYETSDGGEKWAPVKTNPELTTSKEYTILRHIDFANPANGMITGWSRIPKNRLFLPDWMTPDRAMRQRDTPHVNFIIDTRDGGATWNAQEVSMFGEIVAAKLSPDGTGLGLVNFSNGFEYPAEVFSFTWPSGVTSRVYRDKDRAVTDIALPLQGPVYILAVEPGGQIFWSPVPGRLKVLESVDFENWSEMEVDYRASATRATFGIADYRNIWAITDTGMILKLNRDFAALPERQAPRPDAPRVKVGSATP